MTGRVITQGGCNVSEGGGAGNPTVRVGGVGPLSGHGEEVGRNTHLVPLAYHREASALVRRRDVGNPWGGRRMGGSGNAVRDDLQREAAGNHGTVGGATSTIWSVFRRERV